MDWKAELLKAVIPLALSALGIVGTWALAKLAQWLDAKGQESKVAKALAVLPHMAEAVWADVYGELKADIERDAADGVITPEELAELKEEAVAALKESIKKHGLGALKDAVGPLFDAVLSRAVDKAAEAASAASPK